MLVFIKIGVEIEHDFFVRAYEHACTIERITAERINSVAEPIIIDIRVARKQQITWSQDCDAVGAEIGDKNVAIWANCYIKRKASAVEQYQLTALADQNIICVSQEAVWTRIKDRIQTRPIIIDIDQRDIAILGNRNQSTLERTVKSIRGELGNAVG